MTYPRQLPEDRLVLLHPILKKLDDLPEGETLIVRDSAAALNQIRLDLYSWWFSRGTKSLFKISQVSPETLHVLKRAIPRPQLSSTQGRGSNFCQESLLEIEDFDQAQKLTLSAVDQGTLTAQEAIQALSEWERLQG